MADAGGLEFNSKEMHVGFLVETLALGQEILRLRRFYPANSQI
jgi:hypothetical protein